jgi:hypothetical protein
MILVMREVIRVFCWTGIPRLCGAVYATSLSAMFAVANTSLYCFVSDFRVLPPVGLRTSMQYGLWEASAKYV